VITAIVMPAKKHTAPTPTAIIGRRALLGAIPTAMSASRTANGLTLSGSQKSARALPAIEITARKPATSSEGLGVEVDSVLTRA